MAESSPCVLGLTEAAAVGDATARAITFRSRILEAYFQILERQATLAVRGSQHVPP